MVVSAVKDAVDVPDVNKWRAYAVHGGTGVLVLCLIRDVYKKNVSQALAHTYCLGVNWILHNSIYVKELSELVPALGATAQQYSEENDRLRSSIDELKHSIQEFRGLSREDLDARRGQLENLQRQLEQQERQLIAGEARVQALKDLEERFGKGVDRLETRVNLRAQASALHSLLESDGSKPALTQKAFEILTELQG